MIDILILIGLLTLTASIPLTGYLLARYTHRKNNAFAVIEKYESLIKKIPDDVYNPPPVYVDMEGLERRIKDIPNKVLQSIQGSVNTNKGALGELIGYIQLRAQYDRLIPIGNIVDFICIKFDTDDEEGKIDFVDIKTGGSARLSKDQRALQKLIEEKKINLVKLTVKDSQVTGKDEN